jgi:hypothetical protein
LRGLTLPDSRIDRLYELPPAEFTAARNALAAELRAKGDGQAAARVKALRKPNRTAAAANRLIRAEPELVEALLGAGGELRQAHRQAASGRGAEQLRAAAAAEREAIERLIARAPAALGDPPSPALAEALRNTLHAAAGDDEARALIASGRLTEDLRAVGLGPLPRGALAAQEADPEAERRISAAREAESALRREFEAAERSLARSEERLARAKEEAAAATERAAEARKRLRTARSALQKAEKRLRSLER